MWAPAAATGTIGGERQCPEAGEPIWKQAVRFMRSAAAPPRREADTPLPSNRAQQAGEEAGVREAQGFRFTWQTESPDDWRGRLPVNRPAAQPAPRRQAGEANPDFHGNGHRERLRRRLIEGGADALADYEVLEFLLFGARRKGDTKPIAKALIKRFGSLPGVLNASPEALMQVPGVGRHSVGVIMIAAVSAKRMARAQIREVPVLGSWHALIDYLAIDMAHLTRERVRVLYLDSKNRLVKDEHISEGTIDEASVHPREVIHHALDAGASALILVHNHPSGNPEPSRADIQLTHRIAEAGRLVGVTVHDHVIVGSEGHVSLRAQGLI